MYKNKIYDALPWYYPVDFLDFRPARQGHYGGYVWLDRLYTKWVEYVGAQVQPKKAPMAMVAPAAPRDVIPRWQTVTVFVVVVVVVATLTAHTTT
jgi:hypothetical protein